MSKNRITQRIPESWRDLQFKTGEILVECGFEVKVEHVLESVRGKVEVDVYATEMIDGRIYALICECKYWESSIPQTIVHAFRTVVADTGTNKGYILTTSKFQSGAIVASEKSNIELITWDEFQNLFFETWYIKWFSARLGSELQLGLDYHWVGWFEDLTRDDRKLYNTLKNQISEIEEIKSYFLTSSLARFVGKTLAFASLPIKGNLLPEEEYFGDLSKDLLEEQDYKEFLSKFLIYANGVFKRFRQLHNKYSK